MLLNQLTAKEQAVIEKKGTERPFSGEYVKTKDQGVYVCKRCLTPLYYSQSKFESDCGWPSFDQSIDNNVKRQPDRDGSRTEIMCNACGAHLGHVFEGEGYTSKNTRHCVNSISLKFIPADSKSQAQTAVLGGGCFWCLQPIFQALKGVKKVTVGYGGGESLNPSYDEIDGHAETLEIIFKPENISYNQLLKVFFAFHDPSTLNRQGNDVGTQYRSIILYTTLKQKDLAEKMIEKLKQAEIYKRITTLVQPLLKFYPAEEYHQDYFKKNPNNQYCSLHINPKLEKLHKEYQKLLK